MDKLPLLVVLKVLDYLPMVDVFRCRAVCKSWRATIDQFVLDELNVFIGERRYTKYLQLQKRFMNFNRSISFEYDAFYKRVVGKKKYVRLFRNLKKFSYQQQYDYLTTFDELEKLISRCNTVY